MSKQKNFKKKPNLLGFRTLDRAKQKIAISFKRPITFTARPRTLGGHR